MTEKNPLVSIITITLNSIEYLGDLIEGVEAQTYDNIEHVIVDGGSTDGTAELIRDYAGRRNVRWVSEADSGPPEAASKAFAMATGDIVVIVPSDDLIFPWSVKTAVDYLMEHPQVDVVHGDSISWELPSDVWSLRLHKPFTYGYFARTQIITPQATYFRKHVLAGHEEWDESLNHANDYDWILRVIQGRKVVNIPEFLAIFRKRPGAINRVEGSAEITERETKIVRARYIRTSGPVYRVMLKWDRIYGAMHRRLQIAKLLRASKKAGSPGKSLKEGAPWRNFLTSYSVSASSAGRLIPMLLPGRRQYPIDIVSRPTATDLGAAARPEKKSNAT